MQGRAEDGRAREGGLRGRAIRQGLRLQRRALLASAEGGAGDRPAASRPRWSDLSLLGRSPHAARPSSRPGGPTEREDPAGRVLREPSAGQGPAPGSRGLRDRAALGALLWRTGDADAQGYERGLAAELQPSLAGRSTLHLDERAALGPEDRKSTRLNSSH